MMNYGYTIKYEQDKDEKQSWKRWLLFSDQHPLETGKYNYGGYIIRKPPAIIQHGQYSKATVLSSSDKEQIINQRRIEYTLIINNWIRILLFEQDKPSNFTPITIDIVKFTIIMALGIRKRVYLQIKYV